MATTGDVGKRETTSAVPQSGNGHALARVAPSTDIVERNDGVSIIVDLPGASEGGLNISVENHTLTVSAQAERQEIGGATLRLSEFRPVHYSRSFALSEWVDVDKVDAALKNGVLRIDLPISERAKPKKIAVRSS